MLPPLLDENMESRTGVEITRGAEVVCWGVIQLVRTPYSHAEIAGWSPVAPAHLTI
jgi:hypothetical protein